MKLLGHTAYLSWEDVTEGLAADYAVKLPEGVTELRFDAAALEMSKLHFDESDETELT